MCIKMYINKTENLQTNKALFITLPKMHKIVQKVLKLDVRSENTFKAYEK